MSIKILVVDDNRDNLRIYVKALERHVKAKQWNSNSFHGSDSALSPSVESADTVSKALEKLRDNHYSILVIDLKIPSSFGEEMGGFELISASKMLDPLRPIIAVTAYGTVSLARKTLTQGLFDFIEKSPTAVEELIDAVQRAVDDRHEKIRRVGNPFTLMTGIEPTIFGGRDKELKFFEEKLDRVIYQGNCEHFLILGKWGVGKSTLLREYKKICQSRGYIASVVTLEPLQAGTSLQKAAQSMISGVLNNLPYQVDKFKRVLDFFQEINISFLGVKGGFKKSEPKEDNISSQDFLYKTLTRLWKDLEEKTEVLVILFDDVENFINVSEILMTLKSALSTDSMKKCKILIGLAITPDNWLQFTSIQKNYSLSSYFASQVNLQMLTEDDLYQTVQTSLSRTGISFTPEIIKKVYEYTEGHPFKMQLLCRQLFNNQLSQCVDMNVWDKALEDTFKDIGAAIFEQIIHQLNTEETQILKFVANSYRPLSIAEIKTRLEANSLSISLEILEKSLQSLVHKQIINMTGHISYYIQDKMFRIYILNYLDLTL